MTSGASSGIVQARYRLLATLEENEAGKLLYVQDALRQEHLAARVILKIEGMSDETRGLFQRLQQIDHPGIPQLVDFGETDALVFYTRELLGELSLQEALAPGDQKPDIYSCLVEAASALEALRKRSVSPAWTG